MHCSVLWWHKFVSTLFRKFVDFIRLRVREWVWVSTCMCVQITSISVPNIVVAYPNVIPTVDTDQHMITYKNNTQQKRKNSKEHFSILIRFAYSSVTLSANAMLYSSECVCVYCICMWNNTIKTFGSNWRHARTHRSTIQTRYRDLVITAMGARIQHTHTHAQTAEKLRIE